MFRIGILALAIAVTAGAQKAPPAQTKNPTTDALAPKAGKSRDLCVEVQRFIDEKFPDRVISGGGDLVLALRQGIETSPTFRAIIDHKDESFLREMLVQDNLYLEIAGLLGLQRVRPDSIAEAVAIVFLKGERVGLASSCASDAAINVIGTREYMNALAEQLRYRKFEDVGEMTLGEAIIGGGLTPAIIYEWYNDPIRHRLPTSFEALFWSFACNDGNETKTVRTARMKNDFEDFASVPGFPQVVFSAHADEDDPRLLQALRAALAYDTGFGDRQHGAISISLIVRRREYIRTHINIDEIDVPASRRQLLQKGMGGTKLDVPAE